MNALSLISGKKPFANAVLAAVLIAIGLFTACNKMPGASDSASGTDANSTAAPSATQFASAGGSNEAAAPFASKSKEAEDSKQTKDSKAANGTKESAARLATIPSGTPITVRLQSAVSSATSNSGDRFEAVLAVPIEVSGRTVAPAGAAASGRVVAANPSGRLGNPGMIELSLTSVEIGGKAVAIDTSSISAKGASHKKRNWAMIGGGAAGGALLGGLLGGGKGALIGSTVGAGAGTATAYGTGKKDVGFGVERHLTFRLRQAVPVK